jgi:hypothetical protein
MRLILASIVAIFLLSCRGGITPLINVAKYLANLVKRDNRWLRFVTERPSILFEDGDLVERAQACLRFVIERPSVLYEVEDEAELGRCPVCNWPQGTIKRWRRRECRFCRWPMKLRGIALQAELGKLIRRARLRDPWLVARVKAELPWLPDDVVCRQFTGPLAWLGDVWRRAEKPPGRPFDPTRHWGIVGAMEMMMQTRQRVVANAGAPVFDQERQEIRPAKPDEVIEVPGYGLIFREAVKVLTGKPFPGGPIPPRRDGVLRRDLTGEILNALGEDLRQRLGYPAQREEIIRAMRWAREQRKSAQARWAGRRVRVRRSPRGSTPYPQVRRPAPLSDSR